MRGDRKHPDKNAAIKRNIYINMVPQKGWISIGRSWSWAGLAVPMTLCEHSDTVLVADAPPVASGPERR